VLIARPPNAAGGPLERAMHQEFEVHTAAGEVPAIVEAFAAAGADLVVVEMAGEGLDLEALLAALRAARSDVRVVVVGDHLSEDAVMAAVLMDVAGLIVDPVCADTVAECGRQVLDGRLALDQRALRRVIRMLSERLAGVEAAAHKLTPRELQIVRLVGAGLVNRDIAARLGLAEGTIKVHLHNVFHKLQVRGRRALGDYARAKGLV
jgi:DNA-binding NarL/FixJ family response regulator